MASITNTLHHGNVAADDAWIQFHCAHCDKDVSGFLVAWDQHSGWILCSNCKYGSVMTKHRNAIFPGTKFGPVIEGLPEDVETCYLEARDCMSVGAYVASELLCRKLLMHIAVDKGANEGETFQFYLNYLEKAQYITPSIRTWADLIRQNANQATHRIAKVSKDRAEMTVMFTAELLRLVYEMEFMKNKYAQPSANS